jgi:hypothetical protein
MTASSGSHHGFPARGPPNLCRDGRLDIEDRLWPGGRERHRGLGQVEQASRWGAPCEGVRRGWSAHRCRPSLAGPAVLRVPLRRGRQLCPCRRRRWSDRPRRPVRGRRVAAAGIHPYRRSSPDQPKWRTLPRSLAHESIRVSNICSIRDRSGIARSSADPCHRRRLALAGAESRACWRATAAHKGASGDLVSGCGGLRS